MPTAICIVSPTALDSALHGSDPVEIWARLSGESAENMTISLVKREQQYGRSYPVMAHLDLLPGWPAEKAKSLKLGLANALASHFSIPLSEIFIVAREAEPGAAIENGEIIE